MSARLVLSSFVLALAGTLVSGGLPAAAATCTYAVRAHDTLISIARTSAPAGTAWRDLYDQNQTAIGADPAVLHTGQVLQIPCPGTAPAAIPLSLPSTQPVTALTAPTASTAGPVEIAGAAAAQIKHVFVILQENHTFDNYFGTFPGADGFPANTAVPVDTTSLDQGLVTPWRLGAPRTPDLDHGTVSALAAYDGGKMDGFVQAQANRGLPGDFALGYYDQTDLPLYWFLAHNYVLGDRFFSSAMGGSLVNHQYWVGARSAGFGESVPVDGITMPTIFDRLDEAGKSWHFYVKSYDPTLTFHNQTSESSKISELAWVPLLTMPSFVDDPARFSHIGDLSTLYKQLPKSDVADINYIVQGGTFRTPAR